MINLLSNLDPLTVSGVLIGGMGALSTAVVHLYRAQSGLNKQITETVQSQLDECLTDRRALQAEQKDLWTALIKIDPEARKNK